MRFRSTRNKEDTVSFLQAVDLGLAADGGLFVPEEFPQFHENEFNDLTFKSIVKKVLSPFLKEDFSILEIENLSEKAFSFPIKLKKISEQTSILELFHGPTAAFKDVAAQFLAQVINGNSNRQQTILVATSGDTGGAVAAAFNNRPGVNVVLLFPNKGVSPLQRQQLTCWGPNIISLAVEGTFDDCQRLVKSLLANRELTERFQFKSANSINIARLLPQACYFAASALWWSKERNTKANFIIPTGNMGNAVAAFWAKRMGFPINKITMASNANSVITNFYKTGEFQPMPSQATLANAMDVGNPSNFERLKDLYPDYQELKSFSNTQSINDDEIKSTIKDVYKKYGEVICPHTATAFVISEKQQNESIVVATAHPAKFKEIVEPLLSIEIKLPIQLQNLYERRSQFKIIAASEIEILKLL